MLLVMYLFNYISSNSTSLMLNAAFEVVSSTVFVEYTGIYSNTKITVACAFWNVLIDKNSNALHLVIYLSILFWHLDQTNTFTNNLTDGEMTTFIKHRYLNYIIKHLFYDKMILTKQATRQNHFVVVKFKKFKILIKG